MEPGVNEPTLGMKKYSQDYLDACRARVDANLLAYRQQVGQAPSREFEACFFNSQVLLLDYMFVYWLSGIEGKDGNPLWPGPARRLSSRLSG